MFQFKLKTQISLASVVVILALGIFTTFIWWQAKKFLISSAEVGRSEKILLNLHRMENALLDVESGQRGFILTGKVSYLVPFYKGKDAVIDVFGTMMNLMNDPTSIEIMNEIFNVADKRIKHAQKAIEARSESLGQMKAIKIIETGIGKAYMDEARQLIRKLNEKEVYLLHTRMNRSQEDFHQTVRIAIMTAILLLILIIVGNVLFIRSINTPINALLENFYHLGRGEENLISISPPRKDELGKLQEAFLDMAQNVQNLRKIEQSLNQQIKNMVYASVAIASEATSENFDDQKILQLIVNKARKLVNADYAALGIGINPDREFSPWVYSGVSKDLVNVIGALPRPVGLLGWIAREGQAMKLDDLKKNPIFNGFPEGHPDMGPFLGVPIRFQGTSVGNLYLAKKSGAKEFSEQDQLTIELMTIYSGIALENFRLQGDLRKSVNIREDTLAIVSHDLKSPLTTIDLSLQVLKRKLTPIPDSIKVFNLIENMQRSTKLIQRMIEDLLDSAILESGQLQLNMENIFINQLLNDLENQFKEQTEEKKIKLLFHTAQNDLCLKADMGRLNQALSNLISNALKFTPSNGTIEVTVRCKDDFALFTVCDTGQGISKESQSLLFNRYSQLEGTKQKGAGLGLYITRGIVESHGGEITVESEQNIGTCFKFTIPLAQSS